MRKDLVLLILLFMSIPHLQAQISIKDLKEDKNDMADVYYGKFKYQGKAYTGQAIDYHQNGKIKTLRNYKDGFYEGFWTEWYDNGNRKFQGNRVQNKGDGVTKWWYSNGQLKKIGTYDMDKQQGVVLRWYANGNLKQIRHYNQDVAVGNWTTFNENGEIADEGDEKYLFYRTFFNESNQAPKGYEDASPSFTSDGKTLVFSRYSDWMKKVPHIAHFENNQWVIKRLNFVNDLYNLSISPNGQRIVYKTFEIKGEEEITRVFVVDHKDGSWGTPMEVTNLFNMHAGYFQILKDGTLLMFGRKPKNGIYVSKPIKKGHYSKPQWLSDAVGMDKSDSFDVFMNEDKNRLIVSQTYSQKKYPKRGEIGLYYYKKEGSDWKRISRIPLGYAWGQGITPDNQFVFIRNGQIQKIPLKQLNIDWK